MVSDSPLTGHSDWQNTIAYVPPFAQPVEIKDELADALDIPIRGTYFDGANFDFDGDNDDTPKLTHKGFVIPKDKIAVLGQDSISSALKKRSTKKRFSTNSCVSNNVSI